MKPLKLFIYFLTINFGSLALGSWLMNYGPTSNWYLSLNKAPWTPEGWVFGVAWTTIMFCFSIYLAKLFLKKYDAKLKIAFCIQVFLNIIWNFIFFNLHLKTLGLIVIIGLTITMFYFFFKYLKTIKYFSLLILPYMIWLLIATSLNAYIVLNN